MRQNSGICSEAKLGESLMRCVLSTLVLWLVAGVGLLPAADAPKKIVLIAGVKSHGPVGMESTITLGASSS